MNVAPTRLQIYRLERGLTVEQLAHDLGIERTYCGRLLRGVRTPSDRLRFRIARATGLRPYDLFKPVEASRS